MSLIYEKVQALGFDEQNNLICNWGNAKLKHIIYYLCNSLIFRTKKLEEKYLLQNCKYILTKTKVTSHKQNCK